MHSTVPSKTSLGQAINLGCASIDNARTHQISDEARSSDQKALGLTAQRTSSSHLLSPVEYRTSPQ
jgi:hypothetical protein